MKPFGCSDWTIIVIVVVVVICQSISVAFRNRTTMCITNAVKCWFALSSPKVLPWRMCGWFGICTEQRWFTMPRLQCDLSFDGGTHNATIGLCKFHEILWQSTMQPNFSLGFWVSFNADASVRLSQTKVFFFFFRIEKKKREKLLAKILWPATFRATESRRCRIAVLE